VYVAIKRRMQPGDKMLVVMVTKVYLFRFMQLEDMRVRLENGDPVDIVLKPVWCVPSAYERWSGFWRLT